MAMTDLGASALSAKLSSAEIGPEELMAAVLDRIEAVNPAVNAIVSPRPRATLMAEAAEASKRLKSGESCGWLTGIPVAVKDLAQTEGIVTTWGSPLWKDHVPARDDLLVRRLKAAGAIVIGKTNSPEFGLGSHTFNEVFGPTRNPYDLARTPGGSSGGAAAALAARLVPVADGSDMMGSLRNPAAFCNVYGFRPSWGLVPKDAEGDTFLATLATDGPMGRSVEDVARLLGTLAGPTPATPFGLAPEPDYTARLDAPIAGRRIGWLGDWGGAYAMEPGILDLCRAALDRLSDLGAEIVELPPPFPAEKLWDSWITLRAMLNAGARRAIHADPAKRAALKPEAVWEIEQGLTLPAQAVYEASLTRSRHYARMASLFETVDAIAMPSAQVWPFPVEMRHPAEIAGRSMDTYHRWMEVVVPVSLAGLPALSVPVGFGPQGLPMGMQIAGPHGGDLGVLQIGEAWHRATDWPNRRPPAL
ncbi:amidase [Frigidibacter sp. MR17.24]|uniref:amidase n=1 Tax=Frigidibacter sp. MR17.24 TaxID=3127345 RepID=UPI003012B2D1